jgi:hypothetical protein
MKTLYTALIFLFVLGISMGIYTSTYKQFDTSVVSNGVNHCNGINSSYTCIGFNNPTLGTKNNQTGITGNMNTTQTTTTSGGGTVITTCSSAILSNVICGTRNVLAQAWSNTLCFFGQLYYCGAKVSQLNVTPFTTAVISGQVSVSATNTNNNFVLNILSDPLNQAIIVMTTFLGLGVLAGAFGAGILARVMASVALGLSSIVYIEGQLTAFAGLPTLLWFMFNGIVAILLIIIVWEAFNSGGGIA